VPLEYLKGTESFNQVMLNHRSTEEQGNCTIKSYLKVAEEPSTKKQFSPPASLPKKCGQSPMINHVLIDMFRFLCNFINHMPFER